MLQHLPPEHRPPKELINGAKELDRHYIPTHRPDFHPEGAPMDYYAEEDARRAVRYAAEVIEFCRREIP